MSVSQPLAADDAQGSVDGGQNRQGRPGQASDGAEVENPHASNPDYHVRVPDRLTLETRIDFRGAASALVDRIPFGAGRLVIDCSALASIDSVGLNALILVQRRAAIRRIKVVLRNLDAELRTLLVLTKLEDLFELEYQ